MSPLRSRTDVILVVLAVALVCAWFFVPSHDSEDPTDLDWSDLADMRHGELVVHRDAMRTTVRIDRDAPNGSRYSVVSRESVSADPAAVDRLLSVLSHLEVVRIVDEPRDKLGLDHPRRIVEIAGPAETRRVVLGAAAPVPAESRYAEISRGKRSQRVVLAKASAQALDVTPDTLLDHRVLDWLPSELRRIEIAQPLGPLVLERAAGGQWLLPHSNRARARRLPIEQFLLALTQLSALELLDPAPAAQAQRSGALLRLTLSGQRGEREERVEMKLGGTCPFDARAAVVVLTGERKLAGCVDATASAKLTLERAALVDDAAFSFRSDEVERLEVRDQATHWLLTRKDAAFQLEVAEKTPVALEAGNGLLKRLTSVRGEVVGTCAFESTAADTLVALRSYVVGDGDPSIERIRTSSVVDGDQRRLCRDDGTALVVKGDAAMALDLEPGLLRDPRLLDVPVEAIREVRIDSPFGRQWLREDPHGALTLVQPPALASDVAAIETLREQLARLHAARWLTRAAASRARARAPNGSLEFQVGEAAGGNAAGAKKYALRLIVGDAEPTVAWFEDANPFELDPALSEVLDGLLLDRSALRRTSADRTVSLSRGPNQIRLHEEKGVWLAAGVAASAETAAAAIRALEALNALSVYASLPKGLAQHGIAELRVEYLIDGNRSRLQFTVGPSFTWRERSVRLARLSRSRNTYVVSNADLGPVLALLPHEQ